MPASTGSRTRSENGAKNAQCQDCRCRRAHDRFPLSDIRRRPTTIYIVAAGKENKATVAIPGGLATKLTVRLSLNVAVVAVFPRGKLFRVPLFIRFHSDGGPDAPHSSRASADALSGCRTGFRTEDGYPAD